MKKFLLAALYAFALGIAVLVIVFIFLEGWGMTTLVIMLALACCGSGFLMGKLQPHSRFYAGIIISLPLLIAFPAFQAMWELLSSPSDINSKNFYALLPLVAVLFSYTGIYLGYLSAKKAKSGRS
jgi:hypothetical protein